MILSSYYGHYKMLQMLEGMLGLVFFVGIAAAIFMYIVMWNLFEKADEPGWKALIPFYNTVVLYQIGWESGWGVAYQVLCILSGVFFGFSPLLGWITLLLSLLLSIFLYVNLAEVFHKGRGFAAGLIFLPFIFLPILAFGDATFGSAAKPKMGMEDWKCACGKVHSSIVSTCSCGRTKQQAIQKRLAESGGQWRCTCGRVLPAFVSTCTCGRSRHTPLEESGKSYLVCPACGEEQPNTRPICYACGARLPQPKSAVQTPVPAPAPEMPLPVAVPLPVESPVAAPAPAMPPTPAAAQTSQVTPLRAAVAGYLICPLCGTTQSEAHSFCATCGTRFKRPE